MRNDTSDLKRMSELEMKTQTEDKYRDLQQAQKQIGLFCLFMCMTNALGEQHMPCETGISTAVTCTFPAKSCAFPSTPTVHYHVHSCSLHD